MAYTPEQRRNIATANRLSRGHTPRVRRALLEAMAVESNFRQLPYGDRDSVGVLQQRPSQGWGPASESAATDIGQFLQRADRNDRGFRGTAGQLAQSVQRSAFPGRYDARKSQVNELLRGAGGPTTSLGSGAGASGQNPGLTSGTGTYKQAVAQYLLASSNALASGQQPDPGGLLQLAQTRQQSQAAEDIGGQAATFAVDHNEKLSPNAPGIVKLAKRYLGTKYVWGGTTPKGFDCSGFVQYLYAQKGVKIGRTTYDQIKEGGKVGRQGLQPGDVVFFKQGSDVHHEGMYIGHNQFIHAPHTGDVVKISSLNEPYYAQQFAGGRRMA